MRKRNAHQLRKLKQRLSKRALAARQDKMLKGGTWRQKLTGELNQAFAGVATVVNKNQNVNDARNRRTIGFIGALSVPNLFVLGRVLGWW